MNKILISRDKIIYDEEIVNVIENNIFFLKDGLYNVEYLDIDNVEYCFNVNNLNNVILLESSFSNKINVNNKYIVDSWLINCSFVEIFPIINVNIVNNIPLVIIVIA